MVTAELLVDEISQADFLAALPETWSHWPTRVELAFTLTGGGSVFPSDYERFRADSLYDAASLMFDPRFRRRPFRYSLKTSEGVLPPYRFDARWSLLRRGSTGGVCRRIREQRTKPWEYGADTTLLEIWREPLTKYTFKSRLWLRTGGRTAKEATNNWLASASILRRLYREHANGSYAG